MKTRWNDTMRSVALPLMWLVTLFACQLSTAGIIVIPGTMTDGKLEPSGKTAPGLSVHYSTVTADLSATSCSVSLEETIGCGAEGVAAVGILPVPKGTEVGYIESRQDGGPATTIFLSAEKARSVYETIAKTTGKSGVLSHVGKPAWVFSKITLSKSTKLSITFQVPVVTDHDLVQVRLPMPDATFYDSPVTGVSVSVKVSGTAPIRGVFSPSHDVRIARTDLRHSVVSATHRNYAQSGDLRIFYAEDDDALGMRLMTYHDGEEKDGYFMLFGNPTGSDTKEKVQPKDIVFALDVSGSMRGEKMEQARSAIAYCLERLNAEDRFNVVAFGTDVQRFKVEPIQANTKAVNEALVFVDELIARGRTNIRGALDAALKGARAENRPSYVMFLTDGTPTVGERDPKKILEDVSKLNASKKKIFVVGVGNDVNAHLLGKLAVDHNGTAVYVSPEESIDEKVAALYDRLKNPVLSDVTVDFGGLVTDGVFPRTVPTLFKGTDLIRFGRYSGGGKKTVTVIGKAGGKETRYEYTFDFPEKTTSGDDFVASLWATRKVGFLLDNLRLNGENKELLEEVVRLSRKYGIVTEYTAFLATDDVTTAEANALATKKMRKASDVSSGQWAVNQATNNMEMQQRMVASPSVNAYVDRNGKRKTVAVQRVAGRTFYQRAGVWEEASEEKEDLKVRKVKRFSTEYFDLVKANKDFAKAQKLNGKMSINIAGERVVVEE